MCVLRWAASILILTPAQRGENAYIIFWKVPKYNKMNTRKQSPHKKKSNDEICRLCVRLYSSRSRHITLLLSFCIPSLTSLSSTDMYECRTDNDTLSGYTIIFKGCLSSTCQEFASVLWFQLLYITHYYITYIGLPCAMILTGLWKYLNIL